MADFLTTSRRIKRIDMSNTRSSDHKNDKDLKDQEVKDTEQKAAETAEELGKTEEEALVDESEESSPEEAERSELDQVKEELAKMKDQHLRLFADFENFKKRTAKERVEMYGSANMELMSALLPVLDDFKRALKNMPEDQQEGVNLIFNKFESTLKQKGLKPMEDTTGKEFDVDTMEAVTRIPAPDKKLKGKVVDELEQGFYLGTKIIRYARVVVGE